MTVVLWRRKTDIRTQTVPRQIGMVGCVKEKAKSARPAQDLYTSALFAGRRRYVERSCESWWILSAEHGLVNPQAPLEPYDVTLKTMSVAKRREWAKRVLQQIVAAIDPGAGDVIEFHAGADYREYGLADGLRRLGATVVNPTEGMTIGRQLRFYSGQP